MLLRINRKGRKARKVLLWIACPSALLVACSLQPRTCEMTATDDVVDPCGVASDGSTGALPGTLVRGGREAVILPALAAE